jgi:hypothetical protein
MCRTSGSSASRPSPWPSLCRALHSMPSTHGHHPMHVRARAGGKTKAPAYAAKAVCHLGSAEAPLQPPHASEGGSRCKHWRPQQHTPSRCCWPSACRPPCACVYWAVLCCVDDAGLRLVQNPHTHIHAWWCSRGSCYRAGGHDAPRVSRRCCKAFTEERPRHPTAASCVRGVSRGLLHSRRHTSARR